MKINQNNSPKASFKGIICPSKYSHYLNESINEVLDSYKEIIPPSINKVLPENKNGFLQFFKNIFKKKQASTQVITEKNPYSHGRYLFLEDPLQRRTKVGNEIYRCDYTIFHHSIYKENEIGISKMAISEEEDIFYLLKKKMSQIAKSNNNNLLSDESLLKKFGIAMVDDDNTYKIKRKVLENFNTII